MALIKCPECGNDVSEYAECCQICGCPIEIITKKQTVKNECILNGSVFDFSEVKKFVDNDSKMEAVKEIVNMCNIKPLDASLIIEVIKFNNNEIPADYNEALKRMQDRNQAQVQRMVANKPKCPTCNSTNISKIGFGERATSVVGLGLFSKKINKTFKCNNCKYTW